MINTASWLAYLLWREPLVVACGGFAALVVLVAAVAHAKAWWLRRRASVAHERRVKGAKDG